MIRLFSTIASALVLLASASSEKIDPSASNDVDRNAVAESRMHPHARFNVVELVAHYNYSVEKHSVLTEDGYILELHRVTGNARKPSPKGKPAVLVQHGLLCSSMDWVVAGPKRGLGFVLADAGYDVWLSNTRGNRYSRNHANITDIHPEFWMFSWHEIGLYDTAAMIDHVLRETGNEKLSYIGHSQGSTALYVLLSERPAYNDKVKIAFSLAPVAYCSHMTSPVFRALALLFPLATAIMDLIGKYEFNPTNESFKRFVAKLCDQHNVSHLICTNVIFIICGFSHDQMDKELLPALMAHTPAGASTRQFLHFAQLVNSGHFRKFDYGLKKNLEVYKSRVPPKYNMNNVKVPVSLHYSVNDWLSDVKDVQKLYKQLPNAVAKLRVPHDTFNHLDYMWGKDAKTLLYDKILSLMSRYKN